mmetsp:Transcript_28902/g.44708  ORF Transcript_28902/g.44708 Transcript_28902/m.44708 type:complete len:197 (-) Transcript_28902:1677-2267(-)
MASGDRLVHLLSTQKFARVSPEWVEACVDFIKESDPSSVRNEDVLLKKVYDQLLFSDLSEIGLPCLPPNVSQLHAEFLKGPFFLQIDEILNIGEANETRDQESNKRCLKVKMSDGTQSFYGFEYRRVPDFHVNMKPGTKVLLREVMMRRGLAMLQPERIDMLGGEVENPEEEGGGEGEGEGGSGQQGSGSEVILLD